MINKSEELKKFEEALNADESLRNKYEAALKKIADEGTAQSDGEVMVKAAKELGFEISIDEMERLFAEMQELDEQELDNVAGGDVDPEKQGCSSHISHNSAEEDEYGHERFCAVTWHCYTAFLHTETKDKNVSCWSDYICYFSEKEWKR